MKAKPSMEASGKKRNDDCWNERGCRLEQGRMVYRRSKMTGQPGTKKNRLNDSRPYDCLTEQRTDWPIVQTFRQRPFFYCGISE